MQNLHTHTSFSNIFAPFKDSHISYQDLCQRAHQVGSRVVTSVEHGFQGNYLRCWEAVNAFNQREGADLHFVFGTEAYWVEDRTAQDKTNGHILILARSQQGVYGINAMLSKANQDGYYYRPRVDMELLSTLDPDQVLVTTACVSGWGRPDKDTGSLLWHYQQDSPAWMEDHVKRLHAHFGPSLYLEVQAHHTPWQKQVNRECLKLHYALGIPLIAGLDSHFITPEQRLERLYLREKTGSHMGELDHEVEDGVFEDYPDEQTFFHRMMEQGVLSASEVNQAIRNTDIALTFESLTFDRGRKLPTLYPGLSQQEKDALYLEQVKSAWERYKHKVPKEKWPLYEQGIEQETDTVVSTGVSDYFLIAQRSVARGVELGGVITPTSRGSAGSFFTNALLGLTTLDRFALPVKLYPERFVTAERLKTSIPDIDINVSSQAPFFRAQQELLGENHVFPMVSYGTLKEKSAFKVYARAQGMAAERQNQITSQIEAYEKALAHAEDMDKDAIRIEDFVSPEALPYLEASRPYRGIVVSKSPSPCAFMLYSGDIPREVGVMRVSAKGGSNCLCTVVDGYTADDFGFMKMDWLVVSVVEVNAHAMSLAGLPPYSAGDVIRLTDKDKPTWAIFSKGLTQGVNQCEGENATKYLKAYRPQCLKDLAAFVAAIRPGFKSQLPDFIARKPFSYGIPAFDALLKNDSSESSWLLYQENLMTCLSLAGFSMEETYPLIKAISKKKKQVIDQAEGRFLEGFARHVEESQAIATKDAQQAAETVWRVIQDSARYLFNAAHAVAVALDALYGAYLKAHHPYAYYVALLTKAAQKGDKDKIALIRSEMLRGFGISMTPPRFGDPGVEFQADESAHAIRDSLLSIKGIGLKAAKALNELALAPYGDFVDLLLAAAQQPGLTTGTLKALIPLDYFACFGGSHKLLQVLHAFTEGPNKYAHTYAPSTQQKRLKALRELENSLPDEDISPYHRLRHELSVYISPITTLPLPQGVLGVSAVDARYSPKLTLYNPRSGGTGVMRVKKADFTRCPVAPGDVLLAQRWKTSPAYTYLKGVRTQVPGQTELWLTQYKVLSPEEVPSSPAQAS